MPTVVPWPTSASMETADSRPHAALLARIAWLCHLMRAAALGWAAWNFVAGMWAWTDPERIAGMLGRYLNADLGVVSSWQVAWGLAAQLVAWIPVAAVA